MKSWPKIRKEENSIAVEFAPAAEASKLHPIEIVLDFSEYGDVLGIEIINLVFEVGENALGIIKGSFPVDDKGMRYSYDEHSDAFYLRLQPGRSSRQRSVNGSIILDPVGQIKELRAEWGTGTAGTRTGL